jgi:hypothetical protein
VLSRHRRFGDLLLGYNRFLRVYPSVEVSDVYSAGYYVYNIISYVWAVGRGRY